MNERSVKPRARLLLVGAGILVALVVAEVALRVSQGGGGPPSDFHTAPGGNAARWVGHPFLPFTGSPNGEFRMVNLPDKIPEVVRTNSYGFRSHEFPPVKMPEDYFILAFGGSTTYGYKIASNDKTWPELLEHRLAERYPDRRVRAFNLGVDMATSNVSLVNLALVGVHLKPDLVLIYHGYNDLSAMGASNFRTDHAHFYRDLVPELATLGVQAATPRWLLASHLVFYLTGSLDLMFGVNDLTSLARQPRFADADRLKGLDTTLRNFQTLHSIATGAGADIVFSTFQFREGSNETLTRLNDEFREFFARKGYAYVDQDRLIPDHDPSLQVDECHFTDEGNDLLVRNWYDHLIASDVLGRRARGGVEPLPFRP